MPQACSAEKSTEELSCIFCLVGLKGGALVSTLYAYSQHGDPDVKSLVKHLLNQVDYSRILYHMMSLCAYQPRHISDQKWQIFFFLNFTWLKQTLLGDFDDSLPLFYLS